jgi:hypothetical protein
VRSASNAILENDVDLADVDLAAAVEVYSDPASAQRMMAHNHPASQDVGLTAIQETSGKSHSPTLMDLDIQDRGYHLRRISLPRTRVNRARERAETAKSPGPSSHATEEGRTPLERFAHHDRSWGCSSHGIRTPRPRLS